MPLSELNNGHVVVLPEGEECDWAYENRTCGHKLHPIKQRSIGIECLTFVTCVIIKPTGFLMSAKVLWP